VSPAAVFSSSELSLDRLIARLVRGEPAEWEEADDIAVTERVAFHGVAGVLAGQGTAKRLPEAVKARARALAMRELRHRGPLNDVLERFAAAGLDPILLKGAALAYDLFPNPAWRERGDADILVRPEQRAEAHAILAAMGYIRDTGEGMADAHSLQQLWVLPLDDGSSHDVDLHIAPLNVPRFRSLLTHEDALRGRRPLPALGPAAAAPSLGFMLLHAAIHRRFNETVPYRVGSHWHVGGERLIWLVDIDLLARSMDPGDWAEFARLAERLEEGRSALAALAAAEQALGTPVPGDVRDSLVAAIPGAPGYLDRGMAGRAWLDLRSLPVRRRAGYALARLFPSRAFMRGKYPGAAPLPLLYLRRLAGLARRR
jgi:hypothetical protein